VVVLLPAACSGGSPASPDPAAIPVGGSNAWLAYQAESGVRLIHPDGTGDRILTTEPKGDQQHPDWSPDGRHLVMDVDSTSLWVVDVQPDGTDEGAREIYRCQAPCAFVQEGAWSPDGREIAFLRYSQSTKDAEVADPPEVVGLTVETGQERVIYRSPMPSDGPFSPRWSPDGEALVIDETRFSSDRLDTSEVAGERVVIVSSDGSNTRRVLTDLSSGTGQVDWGPRGVIVTTMGGNLWTIDPDAPGQPVLYRVTSYDGAQTQAIQPTWTPDGDAMLFTYVRGRIGVDDHPTLGRTGPKGRPTTVWSEQAPAITHPRLQPTSPQAPQ
jgi:Tol biopolymer transport system component